MSIHLFLILVSIVLKFFEKINLARINIDKSIDSCETGLILFNNLLIS